MPVPNLSETCKGLLRSVKPILKEDEYKKMEALAKVRVQFLCGQTFDLNCTAIFIIELVDIKYN